MLHDYLAGWSSRKGPKYFYQCWFPNHHTNNFLFFSPKLGKSDSFEQSPGIDYYDSDYDYDADPDVSIFERSDKILGSFEDLDKRCGTRSFQETALPDNQGFYEV